MSVAAEIAQHLQGPTEGLLGVDDPVVTVQAANEFCELLRIGESGGRTGAAKLVATVKTFQSGCELAPEDATQRGDGQEESSRGGDPSGTVGCKTASRNHVVYVRMITPTPTVP